MCPAIDNTASCEILAVNRFLHVKNMSAAEIHRELCAVYGKNVMNEGSVRQRCTIFKNVQYEERSGGPSAVSDDLVQSVDQKICETCRFTISELSCEFPLVLHTVLYEVVIVRLGYHEFCTTWVPKMLMGEHKKQRMASGLTFLSDTIKMAINFSITSYE
jgi:hypothetical protein